MASATILLVDDDEVLLHTLAAVLGEHGYRITTAAGVPAALKLISAGSYDVLLSDLHMPGKGDGLTVASAMRHVNPNAATILFSASPDMDAAAQAILLQADQILIKPMNIPALIEAIEERVVTGATRSRVIESVATILEYSIPSTIDAWYERVGHDKKLTAVAMSREQRVDHLPKVLMDLINRLRSFEFLGSGELVSVAAERHGRLRHQQGYSAAMLVQESRILQVSIFETLQKNLASIDFSILLNGVMTIADEVDSQLSQAMDGYIEESLLEATPV
jgi:CheY-like chemotaxis protein